jgi:hypothetical protein
VDSILDGLTDVARKLLRDEGMDDVVSSLRYDEAVELAATLPLDEEIERLEEYADSLANPPWVGSGRSSSLLRTA